MHMHHAAKYSWFARLHIKIATSSGNYSNTLGHVQELTRDAAAKRISILYVKDVYVWAFILFNSSCF